MLKTIIGITSMSKIRYALINLFGIVGAVTPTECPMVQQCNSCEDCIKQFEPNVPKALTCYLDKVSEKLDLVWTVGGIHVEYSETQLKIKDEKSETWNISRTILFVSYNTSCDQKQTYVCYAKNDVQMVTKKNITVHIQPRKERDQILYFWAAVAVTVAVILAVVAACIFVIRCCTKKEMKDASTTIDELKERLKQIYIRFGEYWCGESQYEVTSAGKSSPTKVNTIDELLSALSKDPKNKRVFYIGKSGIGKSRLFRTMTKKWMDGDILQDVILIYLQLENLSIDSNILEALEASLKHDKNSITVDSLRIELQNENSIVMLDGLSKMGKFHNTTQNNDNTNGLTVKQLLLGDESTYKNMKIWISCRSQSDAETFNKEPSKSCITVKHLGFTDPQTVRFFERVLPLEGNSINVISTAWQDYYKNTPHEKLDGRYASPLIAQLFASYYLQTDTIEHLKKFMKSEKWDDLEKVGNFHLLVCLLEAFFQDKDEYKELAKTFHQKEVVFKYISDDYFQEATIHLWQVLNETDRHLKTLDVYGDFPHHLMKYSPTIDEQVVFHDIRLSVDHNDNTSLLGMIALQKCNKVKFSNRTLHVDRTSQQTD